MKLVASASFGFAIVLSGLALFSKPASALQAPAVPAVSQDGIVKVNDYWRERLISLKRHQRCERVRYKCSKRYGWDRHIFRECVARYGCGR